MRLPAPPHVMLAAYCAGLCLVLAWRPPALLLWAAATLAVCALVAGSRSPVLAGPGPAIVLAGLAVLFVCAGAVLGGVRLDAVARAPTSWPTPVSASPCPRCSPTCRRSMGTR